MNRTAHKKITGASQRKVVRCDWARNDLAILYHDHEWGVPQHDDRVLFEFVVKKNLPLYPAEDRLANGERRRRTQSVEDFVGSKER